MIDNKIKQFTFTEFYGELIGSMKDEEAGKFVLRMCKYMFEDIGDQPSNDKKQNFLWGNVIDELTREKEQQLKGKVSKANIGTQYFAFIENFYQAMQLMDAKQGGQYIKAICKYMFTDQAPTELPTPIDTYFALAKRKIDLSKTRKRVGKIGGSAERKTVTFEQVKAIQPIGLNSITMQEFLTRHPNIVNDIYKSSIHLTVGIDWTSLDEYLPTSRYFNSKSLYQILTHYNEIVEQK